MAGNHARLLRRNCGAGAALAVLIVVVAGFLGWMGTPVARAAVVTDSGAVPAQLEKYVPDTPAFANAPWMTSPSCQGKGGDFSIWVSSVITDTPALLAFFQSSLFGPDAPPEDKPRNDEVIAGYQHLADRIRATVPQSYCVADLTRWTGRAPAVAPFGFAWGVDRGGNHRSGYTCTDHPTPDFWVGDDLSHSLGAGRAMCDGFYLACSAVLNPDEQHRCGAWNTFSDKYIRQVVLMRADAIERHPATASAVVHTGVSWGLLAASAGGLVLLGAALGVLLRHRAAHSRAEAGHDGHDVDREGTG